MRIFGTMLFGVLALGVTLAAALWPLFGALLLLLALPIWFLFILSLVRSLKLKAMEDSTPPDSPGRTAQPRDPEGN